MKIMRKIVAFGLAALASGMILAGCGTEGSTGYPVEISGVTVSSQPSGVVVLSDSLADVVLALGYEWELKGKSADCTQEELSPLTDYSLDDIGAIAGSGADTVLMESATEEQIAALQEQGLQVICIADATNRESLTDLYEEVGALMNGNDVGRDRGSKVASSTLMTLDDIERSIPERSSTPTACYMYDLNGHVVTGDSLAGKLFGYAGLVNVFDSEVDGQMGAASIKAGNPQYIFCDTGLKSKIMSSKQYATLSAVKKGRVYEIPAAEIDRQGGTLLTVVADMAGYAYPELISDAKSSENDSAILDDVDDVYVSKAKEEKEAEKEASSKESSSSKSSEKTSSEDE